MIDFAAELAAASGEVIREMFERRDLKVDLKADLSPVTEADREAERILREMIGARFPEHGIVGEEYGTENPDAEYVWTLDPIDGTISFVAGVPLFGTLIGLVERGEPILGVIHQPITHELMMGTPDVTTLNGEPVTMRRCEELGSATLLTTDPNLVDRYQDTARFEELRRRTSMTRTWGDCYGYLMIASGRADIMLDPIMNFWDLVPLIPIIRGAGGIITDWMGESAISSTSIVAASPALHPQVMEILRSGEFPEHR